MNVTAVATHVETRERASFSSRLKRYVLFAVAVALPTAVSIVYYGFIASDVFISESRFVVRMPQRSQSASLLGSIFQGGTFSRSQDDSYSVHDYMLSRDALQELQRTIDIEKMYSRDHIDSISRFPTPFNDDTFEALYKYYRDRVSVDFDTSSSITTLRTRAYASADSHRVNAALLALGETLVNKTNERGRQDLIKFAQSEVEMAEQRARAASVALAAYRTERTVFDPEKQSAIQLQLVGKLQDELIAARTQLAQMRNLSPDNPQVSVLRRRVSNLEAEIGKEMSKVSGATNSLSNKSTDFERLSLERAFADRQLTSALTSLESARNEASRKQIYLEIIVSPNTPDEALEPRRWRSIVSTFLLGLIVWGILTMLLAGIREHRD